MDVLSIMLNRFKIIYIELFIILYIIKMLYKIDKPNVLGESPIWNHFNNTYYWVDIDDHKIKKFDDFYKEYDVTYNGIKVKPTCLALIDGNKLFTVVEDGFGIYDFRQKNAFNYVSIPDFVDDNFRKNLRFNDGKCDRNGNLYIGTMDLNKPRKPIGNIYKLTPDLKTIKVFENISVTNGISFSTNNYNMFFSDTPTKKIYMCKPPNSLTKINYRMSLEDDKSNRAPDGSTIDIENNYYSCLYGGYGVDVFSTVNNNINYKYTIKTNNKNNTCCCFGGINMDKLMITSADNPDDPNDNGYTTIRDSNTIGLKEQPINLNFTH